MTTAAPGGPSALTMYRALVGIGIGCALLIVTVYLQTAPVIAHNRAVALQQAIFTVLPGTRDTLALRRDADGRLRLAKDPTQAELYLGLNEDGEPVGVAIEAAGMGYADVIRLLYGYAPGRGEIVGMQVLESRETPGLGDKIYKDAAFVAFFDALPVPLSEDGSAVAEPLAAVKPGDARADWQIDSITGATISSRAVARIIADANARWVPTIHAQHAALKELSGDG